MSTVIDENVVELRFDNAQFESGVRESIQSIDNLENKLDIKRGAENFKIQFSAMQVVAATVISEITKSAINLGKNLNNMLFGQIKSGGLSRASNIEAAKFMLEGLGVTWKEIEEDINYGVADTAYGLDAAAKAASQLVASGVKFGQESQQMKNTLRGISGVAAMTNSTYEDTAAIFTTIAGQGRVMTMQLRQLEARGLNVAATMAEQMGKTEAEIRDMVTKGQIDFNTFAESMDNAFGSHAKDANKTLTGVLSNIRSALSKIGADFFTPIIQNEGSLVNMLDQVRLFLNLVRKYIQPTTEKLASYVNLIIDNVTKFFKSNLLTNWIDPLEGKTIRLSKKVTDFIDSVKRKIKQTANTILSYIIPIVDAFNAVFGGSVLKNMTSFNDVITSVLKSLQLSSEGMKGLAKTFRGIFTAIKLVRNVFVMLVKAIIPATQKCGGLLDVIFVLTGYVGDLVSKFVSWVHNTKILQTVIYALGVVCKGVASVLITVANGIEKIFRTIVNSKIANNIMKVLSVVLKVMINTFKEGLYYISKFIENLKCIPILLQLIADKFVSVFNSAGDKISLFSIIKTIIKSLSNMFIFLLKNFVYLIQHLDELPKTLKEIGKSIREVLSQFTVFKVIFSILDTVIGFLSRISEKLKEFVGSLDSEKVVDYAYAIAALVMAFSISGAARGIKRLTNSLNGFVKAIKKGIFGDKDTTSPLDEVMKLVEAVAILAACAKVLSTIPTEQLISVTNILFGLLTGVTILYAIISHIQKISITVNAIKKELASGFNVMVIASLFLAMAVSLKTLGDAIIQFEWIEWGTLVNGLSKISAVVALIALIGAGVSNLTSKDLRKGFIGAAVTIAAMGLASKNIAESLMIMSGLDADQIEKAGYALLASGVAMGALAAGISNLGLGNVLAFYIFVKTFNKVLPEFQELSNRLLSKIDAQKIVNQLEEYRTIAGVIAGVLLAFTFIVGKYKVGEQFQKFASSFIFIDIALLLMVQVCKSINKNVDEIERALPALKTFIGCLALLEFLAVFTIKSQFKDFAKSLGSVIIAVGLLSVIAYSLSEIADVEKLTQVSKSLLILSTIFGIMAYASNESRKINIKTLLAMCASLVLISLSLGALTSWSKDGDIENSVTSMVTVMLAMAALMKFISSEKIFAKFDKKQLTGMVTTAISMVTLGGILALMSILETDKIAASVISLSTAMVAFAYVCKVISKVKFTSDQAFAIIEMASAMAIISGAISFLTIFKWNEIIPATLSFGSAMIAFAYSTKLMGKITAATAKNTGSIIKIAASMGIIALALAALTQFDWVKIITSGVSMSSAMLSFAMVLKYVANIGSIKAGDITKLVGIISLMSLLAGGLIIYQYAVKDLDYKVIASSAVGISVVLTAVATCAKIMSKATIVAGEEMNHASIVSSIASLAIVAYVLQAYQKSVKDIKVSTLVASFAGLTTVFTAYAGMQYVLSMIGSMNKQTDPGKVAGLMIASLVNLVIIAGTLVFYQNAVKDIKVSSLVTSFAGISVVVTSFSGMMYAMSKIQNGGLKQNLGIIATIGIVCLSLIPLATILEGLAYKSWASFIAPVVAIGMVLASIMGTMSFIAKNAIQCDMAGILPIVVSMLILLGSIMKILLTLRDISLKEIITSLAITYTSVKALSNLMTAINEINITRHTDIAAIITQIISFLTAFVMLSTLCGKIKELSDIPYDKILPAAVGIFLVIEAMSKAMNSMSNFNPKGLVGFAVSLALITGAMALLCAFDWFDVLTSAGAMTLAMLALSKTLVIISNGKFTVSEKNASSIVKIALSIGVLGAALSLLAHFEWSSILASCSGMSVAMMAFAVALQIIEGINRFKVNDKQAVTLIKLSLTLVTLSTALSLLANYSFGSIISAVGGLSVALIAFAKIIVLINKINLSKLQFTKINFSILIKSLASFVIFAGLLVVLSKELEIVAQADWTSIVVSVGAMFIAIGALVKIAEILAKSPIIGGIALAALAASLCAIGVSLIPLAHNLDKLASAIITIRNAGISLVINDIYALKSAIDHLSTANVSIENISNMFSQLAASLTNSDISEVIQAMTVISSNMSSVMYNNMYAAGQDASIGFSMGLLNSVDVAVIAMKTFANNILNAFREITGWHSPWSTMINAGADAVVGLVSGIQQNSGNAQKAGAMFGFASGVAISDGLASAEGTVRDAINSIKEMIEAAENGEVNIGVTIDDEIALNNLKAIDQASQQVFNKTFEELSDQEKEYIGIIVEAREQYQKLEQERSQYSGWDFVNWDRTSEITKQLGTLQNNISELGGEAAVAYMTSMDDTFATFSLDSLNSYEETCAALGENGAESFRSGVTAGLKANNEAFFEAAASTYTAYNKALQEGAAIASEAETGLLGYISQAGKDLLGYENSLFDIGSAVEGLTTNFEDLNFGLDDFSYALDDSESEADLLHDQLIRMGLVEDEETEKARTLQAEYEALAKRIQYLVKSYQYASTYGNAPTEYTEELAQQISDAEKKLQELDAEIKSGTATTAAAVSSASSKTDEYANSMDDLKKSIEDALKSNERFNRSITDSSNVIISNLKSQVRGTTEWANDLVKLASRGASQALVEELGEMGTEGYSMLEAYLGMTDEQLAEVNKIYENRATIEKETLAKVNASYALAGNQNAVAYLKKLGYSLEDAKALVEQAAIEANQEFNENLLKFADAEMYTDEYSELKTYFQELGYTTKDVAAMVEKANGNIGVSIRNLEMEEAFKKIEAAYFSMYSIISGASDPFSEFTRSFEVTKKSLFRNLNSQVNGFTEWSNKLIILANRGISKGILASLEEAGPESVDKIDAMLDMTSEELEKYVELWNHTEENIEDTSQAMMMALAISGDEDAIAYFESLGLSIDDVKSKATELDKQNMQLTQMKNAAKEVQEEFSNLYDTIKGQISIFEEFDTSAEISGDKMIENMRSQVDGIKEWSKNLTELAGRGMSEGLLKELSELGPQGYEKVAAFVDMSNDQLREANKLYEESLTLPLSTTGEVMASYAKAGDEAASDFIKALGLSSGNAQAVGKAFIEAFSAGVEDELDLAKMSGNDLMNGFLVGLDEMGESVYTKSENMATTMLDTMRSTLGIHSPSTETAEMGKYLCEGFRDGMRNNQKRPINEAIELGKNIVLGLMNGINTQANSVYNSVTGVANKILTVARKVLGINSPSKEFETIGMYSMMGMSDGIKKFAYMSTDSAEDVSEDTLNVVKEAVKSILDTINSDEELVIRPVLDLSNIRDGVGKISSMFKQRELAMAVDVNGSSNQNGGKSTAGTYVFNQYNTSPKALDRIEIYRQTKNQFSAFRGAVK